MDTQNTPVHIRLWHHDFWFLALANMLLTFSVYMLIPVLPEWLIREGSCTPMQAAYVMGIYGVCLFFLGPFCSWLVQHFRRNQVFLWTVIVMISGLFMLYFLECRGLLAGELNRPVSYVVIRGIQGATFGLAQMVLSSTLIIDTCESFQRTEANYSSAWFARFSLSLGPLAGVVLYRSFQIGEVILVATGVATLSVLLVLSVRFPFKSPEDGIRVCSWDRFFLPQGKWMFLNLMLITIVVGLLLTLYHTILFFSLMMAGFLLALLAEKYAFVNADLKSEVITGLIAMGTALLLLLMRRQAIVSYVAPLFVGFSIGIIGSRFLLFFIKLSRHCQRGTSQSTFFLAWESGLSLGLFMGYALFYKREHEMLTLGIILVFVSFLFYNYLVHPWYMRHKNR